MPAFDFSQSQDAIQSAISVFLNSPSSTPEQVVGRLQEISSESDESSLAKETLQLTLRETLREAMAKNSNSASLEDTSVAKVLDLGMLCGQKSLLVSTAPFALYGDALEYSTVQDSEKLFSLLRTRAHEMRSSPLWRTTNFRISFVTLCNRLHKRLSKSQNTRLAGELLLLQAYLIPVNERGGLNVQGRFNTANQTVTSTFDPDPTQSRMSSAYGSVDKRFYETLWSLQKYYSNPVLLNSDPETASDAIPDVPDSQSSGVEGSESQQDPNDAMQDDEEEPSNIDPVPITEQQSHFSRFCTALHEVLVVFEASTLTRQDARTAQQLTLAHELHTARKRTDPGQPNSATGDSDEEEEDLDIQEAGGSTPVSAAPTAAVVDSEEQTPKYLTGPKLMHLQLRDPEFRRTLLLQTQFLLQFLLPPHQFHSLNDLRYLDRGETRDPKPVGSGSLPRAKLARPLSEKQRDRLEALQIRVVRLLSQTPPDASHFTSSLDFLLAREKLWVQFKNQGAKFGLGDFGRNSAEDPVRSPAVLAGEAALSAPKLGVTEEERKLFPSRARLTVLEQDILRRRRQKMLPQTPMNMGSLCLERLWDLSDPDSDEEFPETPELDSDRSERRQLIRILASKDRKFVPSAEDLDEQLKEDELMHRQLLQERKAQPQSEDMVDDVPEEDFRMSNDPTWVFRWLRTVLQDGDLDRGIQYSRGGMPLVLRKLLGEDKAKQEEAAVASPSPTKASQKTTSSSVAPEEQSGMREPTGGPEEQDEEEEEEDQGLVERKYSSSSGSDDGEVPDEDGAGEDEVAGSEEEGEIRDDEHGGITSILDRASRTRRDRFEHNEAPPSVRSTGSKGSFDEDDQGRPSRRSSRSRSRDKQHDSDRGSGQDEHQDPENARKRRRSSRTAGTSDPADPPSESNPRSSKRRK